MSKYLRFFRSSRLTVAAVAKPLVALSLLAGTTAMGVAPAQAATSIVWQTDLGEGGSAISCIEAFDNALFLITSGGEDATETFVYPMISYSTTPSSVTFDVTIDPSVLVANDSVSMDRNLWYLSLGSQEDCEGITGLANLMSCFALVSSNVPFLGAAASADDSSGDYFEEGEVVQVDQSEPAETGLQMFFAFDPVPTSEVTLEIVFGKTESDCGGSGSTSGPLFDFSLDPYIQRVSETIDALPDTL